jgi:hypothetical protein
MSFCPGTGSRPGIGIFLLDDYLLHVGRSLRDDSAEICICFSEGPKDSFEDSLGDSYGAALAALELIGLIN